MKWLILLALFSCGKHQEPKLLDLRDDDGDQVLNHEESELEKYVANYEKLGKVEGVLRFNLNEIVELRFSNKINLETQTLNLMAMNEKRIKDDEYFSEWSKLKLLMPNTSLEFKQSFYTAYMHFENGSDEAEEILLIRDNASVVLGQWGKAVKLQFSSSDLKDLTTGKAELALRKKFKGSKLFPHSSDRTIREKTYRVFYNDGNKSKVMYVSRVMDFKELQKQLYIDSTEIKSDDEFFFNSRELGAPKWFSREFANGRKLLIKTNIEEIRKAFYTNYDYRKASIARENGKTISALNLEIPDDAKVFLRVRPMEVSARTFREKKEPVRYSFQVMGGREANGPEYVDCVHFLRKIDGESRAIPTFNDFMSNLSSDFADGSEVLEQIDEKGIFWEMKLGPRKGRIDIALQSRNSATYIVTGLYNMTCKGRVPAKVKETSTQTNIEGKMHFEVETFVEKIPQ